MPSLLFSSTVTKPSIEQRIKQAKDLLKSIEPTRTKHFLLLLQQRINDFEGELLSNEISSSEKESILEQYDRFAQTILRCLQYPSIAMYFISQYHKNFYYPVGVTDANKPSELDYDLAIASMSLGISLLISSIMVFICTPAIGAIMLAVGVILLFPSCYSLLTPNSPDTIKKIEEEKVLFQIGAQIIKPDLVVEEADIDDIFVEPSLVCCP
ncbi:lpg1689 family Dot/Icm T4SS effector [Legionella fallonii]|uniref:Substrate of the Dot/Icm secretion system n=1 Tax=Legionella fallonii LLAP-10 TaxID=1212491 RepID=A0A098G6G8_9GAMM|nr:hypothetical protein [Legionella fallonii]CEG57105.1 substrate of the Dot/Icm secretion system [Legionella fallonii LLAP-10]